VVTGSNVHLWNMWVLPDGDITVTGEGHTDWLLGCCFHPRYSLKEVVTSSGNATVRIWDLAKPGCIPTLEGPAHAVWDCCFRCPTFDIQMRRISTADFQHILSDVRDADVLRGHKDSVNSTEFLLFSNTVLTSSADKTFSLWDAR
ncbi:Sperm-associated antigen 16 protein, partial [Mesitornis unicolor]